ncbi:MAG TPA: sigma-70 family RNA polymerase sigma factor [Longimicrobiales bacterium]|nr:sigma-70 family RNA polymerase sigma factor [Longimicrobiales bacterium]
MKDFLPVVHHIDVTNQRAGMLAEAIQTEESLISAAAQGSMTALGALYETHSPAVYGVALRYMRTDTEAQDVVHDVFVGLSRALTRYQRSGSFSAWLRKVTVRTALMHLRAQRTRGRIEGTTTKPSETNQLESMQLEEALNALPDALRLPFLLKEVEGYSHSEIAQILNISAAASALRVFRARHALRNALEQP